MTGDGAVTAVDQLAISTFLSPSNTAPVAVGESAILVDSDRRLVVAPAQGLLLNDTDANGDPLRVVLVDEPANGTVVLNETGGFTYTPNPGFTGDDRFTYRVDDGRSVDNLSNVATASIVVRDSAFNPIARPDAYWVNSGETLTVNSAAGLLANDTAMQGTIEAVRESNPKHGKLRITSTNGEFGGAFTYQPDDGFVGTDTFSYFVLQTDPSDPRPYRWSEVVTVEIVVEDPAQNAVVPLDVTLDGMITAKDVLTVINYLNAGLGLLAEGEPTSSNLDVTRNGSITAADALAIINYLNAGFPTSIAQALQARRSEGEPSDADDDLSDDEFLLLATEAAERSIGRRRSFAGT